LIVALEWHRHRCVADRRCRPAGMVSALALGWLYLCSAQQPEAETASGCRDDPSWFARTTGTPCARIHWNRCAITRSDDRVTAARACAVTCGTCALLVGAENGTACVDDDAWRATNGRSCQTIYALTEAVQSYDTLEQCAALRSANRTAAQACPQACGTCTTANAHPSQPTVATVWGNGRAPVPAPADSDGVVQSYPLSQSNSSVPAPADPGDPDPPSQSSALELPPDRAIVLRTPAGTHLPIDITRWNLTAGAAFRTIDIATLGTFWGAQELETVLHIPSGGVASLVLPSDAFAASPGVFRIHSFVNIPHRADDVADTQDLIEVQLLPYNSTPTAVSGAVLGTLRLHLSETASQLLDASHQGGADQMLHGEWREMQSQFQLVPEQLPGRFLIKLYGGRLMPLAFGGVRC
jgi:hypothetical protein